MADEWIRDQAMENEMISPFVGKKTSKGVISYGLSSYGYDVRVSDSFYIFHNLNSGIIDPKNFSMDNVKKIKQDHCLIPPNGFILAHSVEYFKIPKDVLVICLGKSTYARCGIIVNVTPLEPGWEGHITLEFSNTTNLPAKIYANEGVCQCIFLKGDESCKNDYAKIQGKYMNQTGITLPKINK